MSSEEFFMYLTIALVVLVPIGVRVYRLVTMKRATEKLRREFGRTPGETQGTDHCELRAEQRHQ